MFKYFFKLGIILERKNKTIIIIKQCEYSSRTPKRFY